MKAEYTSTIEYLESLQYQCLKNKNRIDADGRRENLEEKNYDLLIRIGKELGFSDEMVSESLNILADERKFSKYEIPGWSYLLKSFARGLDNIKHKILNEFNIEPRPIPLFGSLDLGTFAAEIRSPINNEVVILITSDLFTFANLFSKSIAMATPYENSGERIEFSLRLDSIQKNLQTSDSITRFSDLMLACLYDEQISYARPYVLQDRTALLFADILRDAFEMFVFAHEYSHWILGHLDNGGKREIHNLNGMYIDSIAKNWQEEFEADFFGAILTIEMMKQKDIDSSLSFLGIVNCIKAFEVFERVDAMKTKKKSTFSETHPSATMRIEMLKKRILFDNEEMDVSHIGSLVDELWRKFSNIYDALVKMIGVEFYTKVPFFVIQEIIYRIDQK